MTLFVKEFLIRGVRAVSRETLMCYIVVLLRCVSPLGGTEGGIAPCAFTALCDLP